MSMNIYIGNLSYQITTSDLRDLFEPFGEVDNAKIITDRYSGNSKGFGFVEMTNRNDGQQAVDELNGKEIQGRTIKVSEAHSRRNKRDYRSRPAYNAGKKDRFLGTNSRRNF